MHDAAYENDKCRMVLDIADTDLKHLIETRMWTPGVFSQSMRVALCRGTACGLHYLHNEKRVLHRDMKPSKILVVFEQEPRPLIADFGLATHRSPVDGSVAPTVSMTPKVISNGYIPPELLAARGLDRAQYDFEVDIWSFGVVAFEVATLEWFLPPDGGKENTYIAQRIGTAGGDATGHLRGVKPLKTVLEGNTLAPGILAALQVEPSQRASAGDLERFFSGGGEASLSNIPQPFRGDTISIETMQSFLAPGGPAPPIKTITLPSGLVCNCNRNCLTPGHRCNGCSAKEVEAKSGLCGDCRCEWLGCTRPKKGMQHCYKHSMELIGMKPELRCVIGARRLRQEMVPCDLASFFEHYHGCRSSILKLTIIALMKEPTPVGTLVREADSAGDHVGMAQLLVKITRQMSAGGRSAHENDQLNRQGVFRGGREKMFEPTSRG